MILPGQRLESLSILILICLYDVGVYPHVDVWVRGKIGLREQGEKVITKVRKDNPIFNYACLQIFVSYYLIEFYLC